MQDGKDNLAKLVQTVKNRAGEQLQRKLEDPTIRAQFSAAVKILLNGRPMSEFPKEELYQRHLSETWSVKGGVAQAHWSERCGWEI